MEQLIGAELGGYRLEELIGEGSTGRVYRAEHALGPVAVKVLRPELSGDEAFRERFHDEARLLRRLEDPHLVPVYDLEQEASWLLIVMKYLDGGDLGALLRRDGALPPERALALLSRVAAGLAVAHRHGLVHGDVKPANILLDESEAAYLTDLGIAQLSSAAIDQRAGTPGYMAPEQITGAPWSPATDTYALGCVLFRCLTGRTLFSGSDAAQLDAHLHQPPPAPGALDPQLARFDSILARALAKDPHDRYQKADDLIRDLEAVLVRPEADTVPIMPNQRRKGAMAGFVPIMSAVAVIAAATTLVVIVLPSTARDDGESGAAPEGPATTTTEAGGDAEPVPTLRSWPPDATGYTVIIASEATLDAATRVARTALEAGLEAGVLDSTGFSSLRPGYWVAFVGRYADERSAGAALWANAALLPEGSYVREVVP